MWPQDKDDRVGRQNLDMLLCTISLHRLRPTVVTVKMVKIGVHLPKLSQK